MPPGVVDRPGLGTEVPPFVWVGIDVVVWEVVVRGLVGVVVESVDCVVVE